MPEIFAVIFLLVVLFVAWWFVRRFVVTVPQGFEGVVQRFGRYSRNAGPGLHIIVPLVEMIRLVNVKSATVNIDAEPVITADNVSPVIDGYFIYTVVDAKSFLYEVQNPDMAIKNIMSAAIRSEVGKIKLADVMTGRDMINAVLYKELDEHTKDWGIKIQQASIRQVTLSEEMQKAMESQKKADANKLAAIEQAEGLKQAAILQAQGEKEAAINRAEGEKQAAMLRADGDSEAIKKMAGAQADALRLVNEALLRLGSTSLEAWNPDMLKTVLQFKGLEALAIIGQSPATKILLPADLQGITGLLAAVQAGTGK